MTLDLHPEALLDREARGDLTAEERAHLDAHLAQCAACRLERQLRADFATEAYAPLGNMQSLVSNALMAARQDEHSGTAQPVVTPARAKRFAGQKMAIAMAATLLFASGLAFAQTELAVKVVELARLSVGLAPATSAPKEIKRKVSRSKSAISAQHAPTPDRTLATPVATVTPEAQQAEATAPSASLSPRATQAPLQHADNPAQRAGARPARSLGRSHVSGTAAPDLTLRPTASTLPQHASAPTANVQPLNATEATADATELFGQATRARRDGRTDEALHLYAQLTRRYPHSAESLTSLVVAARLELDRGNLGAALSGYEAYLSTGSKPLREQALVGKAQTLRRMGRLSEEAEYVRRLRAEYPDAPYAKLSEERGEASKP